MLSPLSAGASVILNSDAPKPEGVFEHIEKFKATVFFGIPTLYGQMLEYKEKVDKERGRPPIPMRHTSFRRSAFASPPARRCLRRPQPLEGPLRRRDPRWNRHDRNAPHLHINRPGDVRPGSTGKPVPGYELRLVDEEGRDVPKGEIGTLLVKGGSAAQQYWRKREKTRLTMQGEWINTGDKYYTDKDGYYWCAGRGDDMLKVGGIWVSPVEVENCIMEHPAVMEVAVVGHNDEKGLTKPKAFVVLKDGKKGVGRAGKGDQAVGPRPDGQEKYPRWIEFVKELPKSSTGKIQRFRLR